MGKEFKSHNPRLSPRQRTEVHSTAAEVRGPDRGDKGSNGGKDKTQKRVSRLKRRLFSLCAKKPHHRKPPIGHLACAMARRSSNGLRSGRGGVSTSNEWNSLRKERGCLKATSICWCGINGKFACRCESNSWKLMLTHVKNGRRRTVIRLAIRGFFVGRR